MVSALVPQSTAITDDPFISPSSSLPGDAPASQEKGLETQQLYSEDINFTDSLTPEEVTRLAQYIERGERPRQAPGSLDTGS